MHELGIAQDMWAVAKQNAEANNLKKVTKITIVVGESSGFDVDFLKHSLKDHLLPGTIARDAELEFIIDTLSASCNKCGQKITKDNLKALSCPACGNADISITSGNNSYVQSIEGE